MIEITYSDVNWVAGVLVREVGFDFRYITPGSSEPEQNQVCVNWYIDENGEAKPSCIVGTILHRLGVPLNDMCRRTGHEGTVRDLEDREIIGKVADDVKMFFRVAQAAQDNGGTWFSAVRAASAAVSDLHS